MAYATIELGAQGWRRLLPLGLKLPTLAGTRRLAESSFFEPPVFVQARLDDPTAIQVGAFTSISGGQIGNAEIGRYCAIAPEVRIGAHEHPTDWLTCSRVAHYPEVHGWDVLCRPDQVEFIRSNRKPFQASCPTTRIGHDVWIGQGAFIRSGVTLGDGCVVAAGSIVVKDVPPYAIVAGIPAKVKRYRFDEATIERLLKLQWWRFSLYDFFDVPFQRIDEALDRIEALASSGAIRPHEPARFGPQDLGNAVTALAAE